MSLNNVFEVKRYDFNSNLFNEFQNLHYAKDFWPIVYILSDGAIKEAYVGETTDTYARMTSHLKSNAKNKLSSVHLITSEKFNKSATLDIESCTNPLLLGHICRNSCVIIACFFVQILFKVLIILV
ncbi:GIY-YIG nuclease family protein [Aquirufa sp. OSTEICH-129A]